LENLLKRQKRVFSRGWWSVLETGLPCEGILNSMKVIVSDMGGVLYSFDASFDSERHQQEFDKVMQKLNKSNATIKDQLEGEWRVVSQGLLNVYPIKGGVERMLENLESYKLVIVSTSLVKTSEHILEKIGLGKKAWKVFDISDFGSKKDGEAWKAIFRQLPAVDVIVEDGEKNLVAAEQAARKLGFTPKVYKEVPVLDD